MSMYAMIELEESGFPGVPEEFDPNDEGLVYGQNLGQCDGTDELNAVAQAAGVSPITDFFDDAFDEEEMAELGFDPTDRDENWSPIEAGLATLRVLVADLEKRPPDAMIGGYPVEAVLWDLRVSLAILEAAPEDELFRIVVE